MHVSPRSYLSAGVAVLGAGAIALSPVQPVGGDLALSPHQANALAVSLAASIDPITPWNNTIEGALNNITTLAGGIAANPLPILGQIIANQITYLGELPDIGTILGQVFGNIGNAIRAPFAVPESCSVALKGPCENISTAPVVTDVPFIGNLTQQQVFALLPAILPEEQYDALKPVLDFTTSPISGVLLSIIGPVVGPVLSLVNSVGGIFNALTTGDFAGAINELINIPANFTNALLNGGEFLNLAPVLSLVGVTLPDTIQSIGFNMGGLLSAGVSPVRFSSADPVAGVMFDGLAFTADLGFGAPLTDPGLSVGPLGALIALGNAIADSIAVTPAAPAPAAATAAVEEEAASTAPAAEPAAEAPAADASAEAPAADAAEAAPSADAAEAASAAASVPAQATGAADDTAKPATRVGRSGRGASAAAGDDAGTSASTPKRAGRSAASRAG